MIKRIKLTNQHGLEVTLIDLGARVASILFPVKGQKQEMLLTYDDVEEFNTDPFYLGATCGRVCNRIAGAGFEIDGQYFAITDNDNGNCLHGGIGNLAHRAWEVVKQSDNEAVFKIVSPDLDQGFPGTLTATVIYTLTDDNTLTIKFLADTDKATPVAFTNHCYFNLASNFADLDLQIHGLGYLPKDKNNIPTGEIKPVADTEFDFNQLTNIKQANDSSSEAIIRSHGFDHCWALNQVDGLAATLRSDTSGVSMDVLTDQRGIQLYLGGYLSPRFEQYAGICLEAQDFPNSVNQPKFASPVLRPDEQYEQYVSYRFKAL